MRYTGVHFYNWTTDSLRSDKIIRLKYNPFIGYWVELFHYKSWRIHKWTMMHEFPKYAGVVFVSILILLVDMNNFYGKHFLYIPANHNLLILRVTLWGLCAVAAVRELYDYVNNPAIKKLGQQLFVCSLLAFFELAIILKMYNGEFDNIYLDRF